jgi:hypothetical protein
MDHEATTVLLLCLLRRRKKRKGFSSGIGQILQNYDPAIYMHKGLPVG